MEQYSNKQLEIFQQFYEACKQRKIDPLSGEADKQRALLLAQGNSELVKIFGGQLDGMQAEIYRMGKEYVEQKAANEAAAQERAKRMEERRADEQAAAIEQNLSRLHGRDKRLFFFQKSVEEAQAEIRSAEAGMNSAAQLWASMNSLEQKSESSWGTLGGIAAGVTGSTAVGAAVAADTMGKNAAIRAQNEAISKRNFEATRPMWEAAADRKSAEQKRLEKIQAEIEKVKLHLVEDRPVEELMDALEIDSPQIAYTKGETMVVQATVRPKKKFQIMGNVDAVIDGSFVAELFDGEQKVGHAYLNLPRDGLIEEVSLTGYCLGARPDRTYTVVLLPLTLWLIEKYVPSPIRYSMGYGRDRKELSCSIADLSRILPQRKKGLTWQEIPVYPISWQDRLQQLREEAARQEEERRKAEEARKAAAAAQRKKILKIMMIAVPAVIVVIIAGVLISNSMKNNAAYQDAVALMEEGEYQEAIEAFEALGDYKDSPDQILNVKYHEALSLVEQGDYDGAVELFTELGDYKDSAEQIEAAATAEKEEIYQEGLDLLEEREFEDAYDTFVGLGDYKDSAEVIQQLSREMTAYQEAFEDYWKGNVETIMAAIDADPQYVTFGQQDIKNIKFIYPYIGTWEYLSGDARALSMRGKDSGDYKEYQSITTSLKFKSNNIPYILVEFGEYSNGHTVSYAEQTLAPVTSYVGGDFYLSMTDRGTLLITVERFDDTVVTCEYQRVEQ